MVSASPTPDDFAKWSEFNALMLSASHAGWIFRGQGMRQGLAGCEGFGLRPKAGRADCLGLRGYDHSLERLIFETFKRKSVRLVDANGYSDLDWLALAQHHGVPTRLLDWSSNPLVAAWFAINGGNMDNDCEIFAILVPGIMRNRALTNPFAATHVSYAQTTPRIERVFRQHGVFTIHPDPDRDWDPDAENVPMHRLTIPAANRSFFRRILGKFGFDHQRLMTDIDGIGADLALRYLTDQEVAP